MYMWLYTLSHYQRSTNIALLLVCILSTSSHTQFAFGVPALWHGVLRVHRLHPLEEVSISRYLVGQVAEPSQLLR